MFSREELYEKVCGMDAMGDNATVAIHTDRLKEKLEKDPPNPVYIKTVWGADYRYVQKLRKYRNTGYFVCLRYVLTFAPWYCEVSAADGYPLRNTGIII